MVRMLKVQLDPDPLMVPKCTTNGHCHLGHFTARVKCLRTSERENERKIDEEWMKGKAGLMKTTGL